MKELELIQKLKEFQKIKPEKEWVDFLFLKITTQTENKNLLSIKPRSSLKSLLKIKTIKHSFVFPAFNYRLVFTSLALIFVFSASFVFAKNSLPGNPFYPLKLVSQNIKIFLTPKEKKPVVKLEIAKERLNDLTKIKNPSKEIKELTLKLQNEIDNIPLEIEKLEKKKVVLQVSSAVKKQNEEIMNLIDKTSLNKETKEAFKETLSQSQNKVLSLINETQEIINNCPTYLQDKVGSLTNYFSSNNLLNWTPEEIMKVRLNLSDTEKFLKAGNCLEAIEKLESVEKLMKIHSLEPVIKVETSTTGPENLDSSAQNRAE